MKVDRNSVEGQLDIFEAMHRAAAAVDRMVEEDQKRGKTKVSVKKGKPDSEVLKEIPSDSNKMPQRMSDIIRGASMHASMQKTFIDAETDDFAVIAYIDYNMVYLKGWNVPAVLKKFSYSKEAVDYYMEQLEIIRGTQNAKITDEDEPFSDVKFVMENIYVECE